MAWSWTRKREKENDRYHIGRLVVLGLFLGLARSRYRARVCSLLPLEKLGRVRNGNRLDGCRYMVLPMVRCDAGARRLRAGAKQALTPFKLSNIIETCRFFNSGASNAASSGIYSIEL